MKKFRSRTGTPLDFVWLPIGKKKLKKRVRRNSLSYKGWYVSKKMRFAKNHRKMKSFNSGKWTFSFSYRKYIKPD